MKKIIRLTENDLMKLVKRVIKEQNTNNLKHSFKWQKYYPIIIQTKQTEVLSFPPGDLTKQDYEKIFTPPKPGKNKLNPLPIVDSNVDKTELRFIELASNAGEKFRTEILLNFEMIVNVPQSNKESMISQITNPSIAFLANAGYPYIKDFNNLNNNKFGFICEKLIINISYSPELLSSMIGTEVNEDKIVDLSSFNGIILNS